MIHVLYGADDYSSREALKAIKDELGDADALSNNTTELAGAKLALSDFRAAAEALPFFGDRRLVLVRGLLNRFETTRRAAGTRSAKTRDGEAEDVQAFADAIKRLPPSTVLVLLDGDISKANPLLKALDGAARPRQFSPLRGAEAERWAVERVRRMGGTASAGALQLLVKMVGSDLWVLSGEIDKLVLYAGKRQIEIEDVERMATASREVSIFELVDGAMLGYQARAQQVLAKLLRDGEAPAYILFMLTRQLRLLVRVKAMLRSGHSAISIKKKLGLIDFVYNKIAEQAGRYSMERLREFYHALLDADVAIKSGKYDEDLALSILVTELARKRTEAVAGYRS